MAYLEKLKEIASKAFKDANTAEAVEFYKEFNEETDNLENIIKKKDDDNKKLANLAKENIKHTSFKETNEEQFENGEYVEFGDFLSKYKGEK